MVYRQIAFVNALKLHLRKQEQWHILRDFLAKEEFEDIELEHNKPLALLLAQRQQLSKARKYEKIDVYMMIQMDTTLNRLCDQLGISERIKNTVFPKPYSYISYIFVHIFSCLLPFALLSQTGYFTIPLTLLIVFIFNSIEQIAFDIENPFEDRDNDIPMSALCRMIEIDLKNMLQEEITLNYIMSKKGILM
ncbi:hypothetical protein J8281_12980 [Aquimarina sp. U1-2]|nr:hypothetical protein [Aquimarina sp. U1-2]